MSNEHKTHNKFLSNTNFSSTSIRLPTLWIILKGIGMKYDDFHTRTSELAVYLWHLLLFSSYWHPFLNSSFFLCCSLLQRAGCLVYISNFFHFFSLDPIRGKLVIQQFRGFKSCTCTFSFNNVSMGRFKDWSKWRWLSFERVSASLDPHTKRTKKTEHWTIHWQYFSIRSIIKDNNSNNNLYTFQAAHVIRRDENEAEVRSGVVYGVCMRMPVYKLDYSQRTNKIR